MHCRRLFLRRIIPRDHHHHHRRHLSDSRNGIRTTKPATVRFLRFNFAFGKHLRSTGVSQRPTGLRFILLEKCIHQSS